MYRFCHLQRTKPLLNHRHYSTTFRGKPFSNVTNVIQNFCQQNKPAEAKGLFQDMLSKGMKPSSSVYQHLLYGFGKQGNLEEVRKVYDDMNDKGVAPNRLCKKLLIKYLGETVLIGEDGIQATPSLYQNYIHRLGKNGKNGKNGKEMKKVLYVMSEKGFPPRKSCVEEVLGCICVGGDSEAAKEVFKRFYLPWLSFDLTSSTEELLKKYFVVLTNEEIMETIEVLEKKKGMKSSRAWVDILCGVNRTVVARAYYDKSLSRGGKPNEYMCEKLVSGFEGERNFVELRKILIHMVDNGIEFSRYSFEKLVRVCRGEDFATVFKALKTCMLKEWAVDVFSSRYSAMKPFLYELVNFSDHERILKEIRLMEEQGIHLTFCPYTFAIERLCLIKEPQGAKALLKEMLLKGLKPKGELYYDIICGSIEKKHMTDSKELCYEMHERGVELNPSQHRILVTELCKGRDFETALKALKYCFSNGGFIDGVFLDVVTMRSLIKWLVRSGRHEGVGKTLGLVNAGLDLCNFSIEILCKHNKMSEAYSVFQHIQATGMKSSSHTYHLLICGYGENEDLDSIRSLIRIIREQSVHLDRLCFESLVHYLCRCKDYETAISGLEWAVEEEWFSAFLVGNSSNVQTLFDGLVSISKHKRIPKLLDLWEKKKIRTCCHLYNCSIASLCKRKKMESAQKVFDDMCPRGMKQNSQTYEHMICGYGKLKNVEEIQRLYDEMCEKGVKPDRSCFKHLLYYLCKGGYFESALRACNSCVSKEWFYPVFSSNLLTGHRFLNWLLESSKYEEYERLFGDGVIGRHRPGSDVYDVSIGCLSKQGKMAKAKALFQKVYRNRKGTKPNVYVYMNLMSGFGKENNVAEVKVLIDDMFEKGVEMDRWFFKSLFGYLNQNGELETAFRVCKICVSKEWFPEFLVSDTPAMETLLNGLLNVSKHEEAGDFVKLLLENGNELSLHIYNFCIEILCKLQKMEEAKALYRKMCSSDTKPDSYTCHLLISGFGEENKVEELKWLYNDMCEKSMELDKYLFRDLIHFLCKGGDYKTALQACKKSMSEEWFPEVFSSEFSIMKTLVDGLVENSMDAEACEFVSDIGQRFKKEYETWKGTEMGNSKMQFSCHCANVACALLSFCICYGLP